MATGKARAGQGSPRRRGLPRTLGGVLLLVGVVPVLSIVGLIGADTIGRWRINAHSDEWRQAIAREIPPGTSKAHVLAFFAARGVALSCNGSERGEARCGARERRDFGVMPVWSLYFEVTFRTDALVSVRQQARGIGF